MYSFLFFIISHHHYQISSSNLTPLEDLMSKYGKKKCLFFDAGESSHLFVPIINSPFADNGRHFSHKPSHPVNAEEVELEIRKNRM